MVNFLLKCILTILTLIVDFIIGITSAIVAILLWERKWMKLYDYCLLTSLLWDRKIDITL